MYDYSPNVKTPNQVVQCEDTFEAEPISDERMQWLHEDTHGTPPDQTNYCHPFSISHVEIDSDLEEKVEQAIENIGERAAESIKERGVTTHPSPESDTDPLTGDMSDRECPNCGAQDDSHKKRPFVCYQCDSFFPEVAGL